MDTKKELVKLTKAIRGKYHDLKKADFQESILLGKTFEPVTSSIKGLNPIKADKSDEQNVQLEETAVKSEPQSDDSSNAFETSMDVKEEQLDLTPRTDKLNNYLTNIDSSQLDKSYGIRVLDDGYALGKRPVHFDQNYIVIEGQRYQTTDGLLQLLFLKEPEKYTKKDLNTYKKILKLTEAHLDKIGRIKSNPKNKKYNKIVRKLFQSGSGQIMNTNQPRVEYYRDADELVDRLRKLLASQTAGNTGVHNEIVSIVEELKELGIIY